MNADAEQRLKRMGEMFEQTAHAFLEVDNNVCVLCGKAKDDKVHWSTATLLQELDAK